VIRKKRTCWPSTEPAHLLYGAVIFILIQSELVLMGPYLHNVGQSSDEYLWQM
jgi:hypothetical protein